MKETWRWFGPKDLITLAQVKQAGASGIATALHHLYRGEPWPLEEILKRKSEIESAGLVWSVVESIPVHNSIKLRSAGCRKYVDAWKDTLAALGKAGIHTVCYNFMPVVDWTRTDLRWLLPSTGYALRFDALDFAAYDLFILERKNAASEYRNEQVDSARKRFDGMSQIRRAELERNIIAGLPGAEASYDREAMRRQLGEYEGVSGEDLAANLNSFLGQVVPVAVENGMRLCIHPDDPPWSLFGLPRVVSTAEDVRRIFSAAGTAANGLTFCVGSFGARADNDLLAMIREFGPRIYFVHLRQVTREADGSFFEAEHLHGSSDMIAVTRALLEEEMRRRSRGDSGEIPMRPDHGHLLADDIDKQTNPGYSYLGRLKGLAELRGTMEGLKYACPHLSR